MPSLISCDLVDVIGQLCLFGCVAGFNENGSRLIERSKKMKEYY